MSNDQDEKKAGGTMPDWQRAQKPLVSEQTSSTAPAGDPVTIEQAKKFLLDEKVRTYPRERKVEFLRSKGLEEDVVERLLQEEDARASSERPVESEPQTLPTPAQPSNVEAEPQTLPTPAQPANIEAEPQTLPTPAQPMSRQIDAAKDDRPPIVTYPEFLTKASRPPPLMTVDRFLNTLYAFGGLSTLVYGASKYVVAPMVDNLTEARISLHDTAKDSLARLVTKLEETVSEIPATTTLPHKADTHDSGSTTSEYDDPTELFHRDIGIQTSLPPSPGLNPNPYAPYASALTSSDSPDEKQARRLSELAESVRNVSRGFVSHSEDSEDVRALLGVLKDELDEMNLAAAGLVKYGTGSVYGYGSAVRGNEPDDEIKKAKENVRRVKGVLLSARSFPAGR